MKKVSKILIIILTSIALIIGGYYSFIYAVTPKVFDYFLEKNIEVIKELENNIEKKADKNIEKEIEKNIEKESLDHNTNKPKYDQNSDQTPQPTPQPTPEYSAKTSLGSISNADLLKAMKNISPTEKARIIGILKSGVPSSQIPKFAAMSKDGLDSEEKRYIENYMRANLPNSSKQEILNIILKYTK